MASLPFSLWPGRRSGQSLGLGRVLIGKRPGPSQQLSGSPDTGSREAGAQFPNSVGKDLEPSTDPGGICFVKMPFGGLGRLAMPVLRDLGPL